MCKRSFAILALIVAVGLLCATPAAQGKGHGKGHGKGNPHAAISSITEANLSLLRAAKCGAMS